MGRFTKNIIILAFSVLLLYLFLLVGFRIAMDMTPGRDHFYYLDEDKRYEFLMVGELALSDQERGIRVASCIEKYIQKDIYIYIIEDPCPSTGGTEDGTVFYYDRDLNSGKQVEYKDLSGIPRYTVLNYETSEVIQYISLDEMSEEDRAVFEEPLTEECLVDRTCYEK